MQEPEFEPEFYAYQIKKMEERYAIVFGRWDLSWNKYYNYVKNKLKHRQYWIWICLCGFEKFIQEQGDIKQDRSERIYRDVDERIARIIGDELRNESYIRSL